MERILISLFMLTAFSAYAQDNTAEPGSRRVQIGAVLSPDVCFRALKNNDRSPVTDYIIGYRRANEIVKISQTVGVNVCFTINTRIDLETGIQYSNKGYQTRMNKVFMTQPDPAVPEKFRFVYNFDYIDIPVKANFTIKQKKVRYYASVGLTTNVFVKGRTRGVYFYSDRRDVKTVSVSTDFKIINISPTVGLGIDYKINDRINLRAEPAFRYGVLKIIDTPVTEYLYSGGLNLVCYFGL